MTLREPVAVLLEGSLAEGFGSSRSDVDLTFVVAGEPSAPTMRQTFFEGAARYEAFIRTESDLIALAEEVEVAAADSSTDGALLDRNRLDDYLKLSRCIPLKTTPAVARILPRFRAELAARLVAALHRRIALDAMLGATALTRCGLEREASCAARLALATAMKASLAERGEAYLKEKFLEDQMVRAGEDPRSRDRFWSLYSPGSGFVQSESHTADCVREAARLLGAEPRVARVLVARHRASSTHSIGDRNLVVIEGTRIFGLGSGSEALWRAVETPADLELLLQRGPPEVATGSGCLRELVRAGLVEFRAANGGEKWSMCDGRAGAGWVSATGTFWGDQADPSDAAVVRFVGDSRQVAERGANLAWHRLLIDNSWEDVQGSYADGHWRRLEAALRKIVRTCAAMLSITITGRRPSVDEPVMPRPEPCNSDVSELMERCAHLEFLSVRDRGDASAAMSDVSELVRTLPAELQWSSLPETHSSSTAFRSWIEVAADWMQLAREFGGHAPVPEMMDLARDLPPRAAAQMFVVDVD